MGVVEDQAVASTFPVGQRKDSAVTAEAAVSDPGGAALPTATSHCPGQLRPRHPLAPREIIPNENCSAGSESAP